MQMKKKLITTVIIVIALLMGIQWVQHHHSDTVAKEIPVVCTQTVKLAGDTQEFTYSGEVVGRYQSQMSFQTGGKIISRNVEAGSEVKKGELLMKVDPQDVEQSVKAAQSQMAAAQSQFDFATDTLKRYQKLYEGRQLARHSWIACKRPMI
ncbi:biotin/lipoyl-binding protein [Aminipila sp.]|uniref:biotin/lipoyl-binding protein n=1 Tax=Aminipila sp. TaxID=2060095 RepID=UPI002897BED2|nr:biotin/lipoyl-binding protein [Aminipila sp.]